MVIGGIAIAMAFVFFFLLKTNFYKGAAIPLLAIGLIQLTAGTLTYKNADEIRIRNVYAFDMHPSQLKNEELPRMKAVLRVFAVVKWPEMAAVMAGLVLVFYFRSNADRAFWYGLGITLAIQALLVLLADYSAERRAVVYTKALEDFEIRGM